MYGVCLGLFLAPALAAAAAPERGAGSAPHVVIVLDDQLDGAARELLEQSLRELLARIDLQLGDPSVTPDADVMARVDIELSAGAALVSVSLAGDTAELVRYRVERTSDELFRETLAHVILSAVEPRAALQREPPATGPSPAVEPLEPEPPEEASHVWDGQPSWSLGARAGPLRLAAGRAGVALGASLAVAFRLPFRPSAALEASYLVPVLVRDAEVDAQLSRIGLGVRARAEPWSSERMALQLGLGCGLDVLALTPGSLPPELSVNRSARLQPLLGASAAGRLRLIDGFDVVPTVGVDLELLPRRWWIEGETDRQQFYATPRWLLYAALGFEWQFSPARDGVPP